MKNIALIVLFLSLLILIASCREPPIDSATVTSYPLIPAEETNLPSPPPTKTKENNMPIAIDQEAIYSLFVDDAEGKVVIIREDTFTDTYSQNAEETENRIKTNLLNISDETLNNYLYVNSDASKLSSNMNLGVNYILISTPEFVDITSNPDWRDIWRQRYPNSEVGSLAFSRIGFNDSRSQALVFVARLWVDGGYYLLEYNTQKGGWEIVESFISVIIN
jgi:hypothetical protein